MSSTILDSTVDSLKLTAAPLNETHDDPQIKDQQPLIGAAFSQMLLNIGFGVALFLAAGCLALGAV